MIVIITDKNNQEVDAIIKLLPRKSYFLIENDAIHSNYEFELNPSDGTFSIRNAVSGKRVSDREIRALWVTNYGSIYRAEQNAEKELTSFFAQEYYSLVTGIVAMLENRKEVTIVNHPVTTYFAGDKIRQMLVAAQVGFTLPEQVIVNRPAKLKKYKWIKQSVIKPLHSSNRLSIGKKQYMAKPIAVNKEIYSAILEDEMELTLHHFQERIGIKAEYRVVVFNKKVFAYKLTGEYEIDWRDHLKELKIEHDPYFSLSRKCLAFVKKFKLGFGVFDFIDDGKDLYFIECNPPGHFYFCDPQDKSGMLSAFADYLLGNK